MQGDGRRRTAAGHAAIIFARAAPLSPGPIFRIVFRGSYAAPKSRIRTHGCEPAASRTRRPRWPPARLLTRSWIPECPALARVHRIACGHGHAASPCTPHILRTRFIFRPLTFTRTPATPGARLHALCMPSPVRHNFRLLPSIHLVMLCSNIRRAAEWCKGCVVNAALLLRSVQAMSRWSIWHARRRASGPRPVSMLSWRQWEIQGQAKHVTVRYRS